MRHVAFLLGTPCVSLMFPCFWYLPSRIFKGAHAAAITTLGSHGGFLSQNMSGMTFPARSKSPPFSVSGPVR